MSAPRVVFLDPDDTLPPYLAVILEYPTGVHYQQQCAGTETAVRSAEGYYVPLGGLRYDPAEGHFDIADLTAVFHQRDGCVWGGTSHPATPGTPVLPPDRLGRLKTLVETITYWGPEDQRTHLRLDESRLGEIAEAWVPVLTPDGPGILTWPNCD